MTDHQEIGVWSQHRTHCVRCMAVDAQRPATFGHTCLEGAQILKDWLAWLNGQGARWPGRGGSAPR